jgi:hypothetical protein
MKRLEQSCESLNAAVGAASQAVTRLQVAIKALQRASISGDILKIAKSFDVFGKAREDLAQQLAVLRDAWPFSPSVIEQYLRENYEDELITVAAEAGLSLRRVEGRLFSYPTLLRVLPSEKALQLDRRKTAELRPSHVVAALRKLQSRRPRLPSDRFAELLFKTYLILNDRRTDGTVVSLARIYDTITLFPGSSGEYELTEFLRDLFQLQANHVEQTKGGQRLILVPPATATKEGKGLFFLSPTGETIQYYGIRFVEKVNVSDD